MRRWDVRQAGDGEWVMEVKATRDVEQGEQLLLSYGERSNDDFFLHYVGVLCAWAACRAVQPVASCP